MITDFLASLSFYFIPYLTGRFFTKNPIQAWILGAFLWFIAFLAVGGSIDLFNKGDFSLIIRFSAIVVSFLSLVDLGVSFIKKKPKVNLKDFGLASFLMLFATFIYFLVWKRDTPYPLQLNWDMYEHITLANNIYAGKVSFLTSQISDTFTFNSYSPIFGVLLSIPKILFQKSLIGIYWWLEYWHYLLTALATFLLAKKVFKNYLMSGMAVIISLLTFESLMAYTTLFLIPQTLVALLTVLVLIKIEEYKLKWLILIVLTIFLMHYIVGVISALILIGVYLSKRLNLSIKVLNIGIISSILVILASICMNYVGRWEILAREEAKYFNFSFIEKAGFLLDWYGLISFSLILLGCLKIVKSGTSDQKIILATAIFILAIILAPFSYFLKFYVIGHYLLNIVIVAGIGVFLLNLPRFLKVIGVLFITSVFTIIFYTNQLAFKKPLFFGNFNTNISPNEVETGKWLSSYDNKANAFLISDPTLQYILEAASGVNSAGGAYMSLENRRLLSDLGSLNQSSLIRDNLLKIKDRLRDNKDREVLFVVGGRYFSWQNLPHRQKDSIFYNIWSPKIINDQNRGFIDFLKESPEFKPVYENDELIIFSVGSRNGNFFQRPN